MYHEEVAMMNTITGISTKAGLLTSGAMLARESLGQVLPFALAVRRQEILKTISQ